MNNREKKYSKTDYFLSQNILYSIFFFHHAEFIVLPCEDNCLRQFLAKAQFSAFIPLLALFGNMKSFLRPRTTLIHAHI